MSLVSPINKLASFVLFFVFFPLICPFSDVRIILKEEFELASQASSLSKPLPVIFGIPRFLDDISSNLTRGAIEVLPTLLRHASPSTDLLTVLKQPFDNEVISRNSSSWCTAKADIHNYLMVSQNKSVVYRDCVRKLNSSDQQHDPEYCGPSNYNDRPTNVGEDERMPDFEVFLHPKAG